MAIYPDYALILTGVLINMLDTSKLKDFNETELYDVLQTI